MSKSIMWFRRDLRLDDNPALDHALSESRQILLCYVLDPSILQAKETGSPRVAFFLSALRHLHEAIRDKGGQLSILEGKPEKVLLDIARAQNVELITWNRDYEPYAVRRDEEVARRAREAGISIRTFHDQCLQPPGEITKADGKPYVVFTPYYKQWLQAGKESPVRAPDRLKTGSIEKSRTLPDLGELDRTSEIPLPPADEISAQSQLDQFIDSNLDRYDSARDIPFLNATSRLSPYLRFGILSPRRLRERLKLRRSQGAKIFLSELAWRDFYKQILHFFPHVATGAYRKEYDAIPWPNDKKLFKAWCDGRTGFPIVDAAMRQLNQTGWMHNRLRMIVASFLAKDLQIDWRWGERYFMQKLIDGDLSANNGGWQWAAGTGTDAAPYFRIFNPTRQAERFDPEGKFIEQWVPEIDTDDYPPPIVDHKIQRDSTLKLYKSAISR
jgi:deoxyribodipyrimidine photo-lyase